MGKLSKFAWTVLLSLLALLLAVAMPNPLFNSQGTIKKNNLRVTGAYGWGTKGSSKDCSSRCRFFQGEQAKFESIEDCQLSYNEACNDNLDLETNSQATVGSATCEEQEFKCNFFNLPVPGTIRTTEDGFPSDPVSRNPMRNANCCDDILDHNTDVAKCYELRACLEITNDEVDSARKKFESCQLPLLGKEVEQCTEYKDCIAEANLQCEFANSGAKNCRYYGNERLHEHILDVPGIITEGLCSELAPDGPYCSNQLNQTMACQFPSQ